MRDDGGGMTVAMTGSAATTQTWVGPPKDEAIPNASGAIACEVNIEGELVLRPLDALAAYFLDNFWRGDIRGTWVGVPLAPKEWVSSAMRDVDAPQRGLREVRLRVSHGPVLSRGGNPLYTGIHVHPEDYEAARAFVDELRQKRAAAYRKEHPRKKPRPIPTKAKTKRKPKAGKS